MLSLIFIWLLSALAFYFFLLFCVFLLASAFGTVSHLRTHTRTHVRTQSRIAIGFVFRFTEDLKTNAISRIRMRIRESRTIRTRYDMARYDHGTVCGASSVRHATK